MGLALERKTKPETKASAAQRHCRREEALLASCCPNVVQGRRTAPPSQALQAPSAALGRTCRGALAKGKGGLAPRPHITELSPEG